MRLLYGVQGTGNGHITRARLMANALARRGARVDFIFSGRPPGEYFDMAPFGDYQTREGLTFVTRRGRIRPLGTLRRCRPGQLLRDIRELRVLDYDLVINDFEPVSAWAARNAGVPCLALSHQAAFLHPVPRAGGGWLADILLHRFAPADYHLGLHWHHFDQPLLPPLVEPHPPAGRADEHQILVYLPFECPSAITRLLAPFGHYRFVSFHPRAEPGRKGTLEWHSPSRQAFRDCLQHSAGVIANSGFELPSEALSLGRKLLVKPVQGQFEQASNALALQRLGLARVMPQLDREAVAGWLAAPAAMPVAYPEIAPRVADWVLAGRWEQRQALCQSLWTEVRFPPGLGLS